MTRARLRVVAVAAAAVFAGDLLWLNVDGDLPDGWWIVAVPVGLFVVPLVAVVAFVLSLRTH